MSETSGISIKTPLRVCEMCGVSPSETPEKTHCTACWHLVKQSALYPILEMKKIFGKKIKVAICYQCKKPIYDAVAIHHELCYDCIHIDDKKDTDKKEVDIKTQSRICEMCEVASSETPEKTHCKACWSIVKQAVLYPILEKQKIFGKKIKVLMCSDCKKKPLYDDITISHGHCYECLHSCDDECTWCFYIAEKKRLIEMRNSANKEYIDKEVKGINLVFLSNVDSNK
jgi:hypothetical protein